jgi:hypothetical protein
MKKRLLSAAFLAVCIPLRGLASPVSTSAGRPSYHPSHSFRGTGTGNGYDNSPLPGNGTGTGNGDGTSPYPGTTPDLDAAYESWLYPTLTRLIQDLSARRLVGANNSFLSVMTTLKARLSNPLWASRYSKAWSQVSTAKDLVRQGYHTSAADMMQVLLNDLRATAVRLQRPRTPFPGTGNYQTQYPHPTQRNIPYVHRTASRRLRATPLDQILGQLQNGDLTGARQGMVQLAQSTSQGFQNHARRLRFVARFLSPQNSIWALRQISFLRNQVLALGG